MKGRSLEIFREIQWTINMVYGALLCPSKFKSDVFKNKTVNLKNNNNFVLQTRVFPKELCVNSFLKKTCN